MEQENLLSNSSKCRLCCEENKQGINLFSERENSEELYILVNRYLPIKVEIDDPFPKTICPGCHIQLEATKLFMDLIIEGQAKLRTLLKTQHERLTREEKERQKLEDVLQNHNPNASVETYTIQTDENGEKFIIQIFSEGPLFLPGHELTLKSKGLNRPKRKRGRPPRPPKSDIESEPSDDQVVIKVNEPQTETVSKNKVGEEDLTDSDGRKKRIIKAPARYEGVVQGKELDKILKKEGVIDEEAEEEDKCDSEQKKEKPKTPIGKVVTDDGKVEQPVYFSTRPPRHKKHTNQKGKHKYICDICKKEFLHIGRYELHKKSHNIKYSCQEKECNFQDESKDVILKHQKETNHVGISRVEQIDEFNGTVLFPDTDKNLDETETPEVISEEKPLKCIKCEKSFTCKQNYEVHLKAIHNGEKPYQCEICQRSFAYACSLKNHLISHKNNENKGSVKSTKFPCDKCDKVFQHPSSLFYHKDTEHGNQRFICNICERSFKHRQLLQRHQLVHTDERPFECLECGLSFKSRTNLTNHENVHSGLKKHTCPICDQVFSHKTSLAMHIRWHEGHKPFECDVCQKKFSQKGNLVEHTRIHTGEKPYTCEMCGKSFTTSSQYKLHNKSHTGEKPYSCEYCQKRFLHKETFDTHIRRHLDIRPFKCKFCPKAFTEAWACSRHQRIHLGLKPYHCGICDRSFSDASNFTKHSKTHNKTSEKIEPINLETQNNKEEDVPQPPIDIQIIIPPESESEDTTKKKSEAEGSPSNLQIQELLDSDGNVISFTTADGEPIPIVSSGNKNIQGLMPDGTLISLDILSEGIKKDQEDKRSQETSNQASEIINTEIQFLEGHSNSSENTNEEKTAFLSEDGKVCFIASFDENSFLTMS